MVVMILERVTPSLRGEMTRWMLEPKTGVFVGDITAMVRERLWERVCKQARSGAAMIIHSTNSEQGFGVRMYGDTSRLVEDYDGLTLIRIPERQASTSTTPSS